MNRGQQEYYKRDYAQAKAEGKPFFPYAVYKDLLIASLAIGIVIALAIWHRVPMGEPVNPASTDFVPRPDWYFFFLFELLKIFKNQNAFMPVIMATFIIPNILMALLILTPFIDRGPERRIEKRPIALFAGVAVILFLAYMTNTGANSDESTGATSLPLTGLDAAGTDGVSIFLTQTCASCHKIAGVGGSIGPDLSKIGTTGKDKDFFIQYVKDPAKYGNTVMPKFGSFTPKQYEDLGTFLAGLGTKYK